MSDRTPHHRGRNRRRLSASKGWPLVDPGRQETRRGPGDRPGLNCGMTAPPYGCSSSPMPPPYVGELQLFPNFLSTLISNLDKKLTLCYKGLRF